MDFMTKLERKFGKYSIPNLTFILIVCFVLGYIIQILQPNAIYLINLNPELILRGQIWRLLTWVIMPPNVTNFLFVIISLMFYFHVGRTLENAWGDFKYSMYITSGIVFTDLGVIGTYVVLKLCGLGEYASMYASYSDVSTYYLCMSMFLAYAFMFPDMRVLLYMIIPVKVKWLGYLDIAYLLYSILMYGMMGYYPGIVTIVMSILNFIVYYFLLKGKTRVSAAHKKRARNYKKEVRATQMMTRHKCAICGQTEEDNPDLEFRYCSRCNGNYEYCQNHLFTHPHKK